MPRRQTTANTVFAHYTFDDGHHKEFQYYLGTLQDFEALERNYREQGALWINHTPRSLTIVNPNFEVFYYKFIKLLGYRRGDSLNLNLRWWKV